MPPCGAVGICALIVLLLDPFLGVGGESALFFIGVLVVACSAASHLALSAVLSGLLLNYFLVDPRYTFTIAEADSAVTIVVLLLVASPLPRSSTARRNGPGRRSTRRRRPNCSRCSPGRSCAART